jgi:hypothetical protein
MTVAAGEVGFADLTGKDREALTELWNHAVFNVNAYQLTKAPSERSRGYVAALVDVLAIMRHQSRQETWNELRKAARPPEQ